MAKSKKRKYSKKRNYSKKRVTRHTKRVNRRNKTRKRYKRGKMGGAETGAETEPLSPLSRFSSRRTVNVDNDLLSDTNIGMINGHGNVGDTFFVVPEGVCLWVLSSAGNVTWSASPTSTMTPTSREEMTDSNYRRYPPGSLIQEQSVDTLSTQGPGDNFKEKLRRRVDSIRTYSPSFLLTGKTQDNIAEILTGMEVNDGDKTEDYGRWSTPGIGMDTENRQKIEEVVFSEHDERIIPKSELMNDNDGDLEAAHYSLSDLLKTIRVKQGEYDDIPTNWIGSFCRSGTALNVDYLKRECRFVPGLDLDDDDFFGGTVNYDQTDVGQLTNQSSLSARRVPSNFKLVLDELHGLFNSGGGNVFDGYADVEAGKNHFRLVLSLLKDKVDNTETLILDEICIIFLLRKINL
jgi:hypothetical protein